jgi:hypothetical protein
METLDAIWTWLSDPENQKVLTLLGGALGTVVAAAWALFKWKTLRSAQPPSGGPAGPGRGVPVSGTADGRTTVPGSGIRGRHRPTRSRLRCWWSDRRAVRRYLDRLVEEHQYFTFLGRAKPLDLDTIYIALKVGEYVPPQERPDEPAPKHGEQPADGRAGTVEVPEALLLDPPRLLVLGEAGSGKTTLLKHLALRIAHRDKAFGEFARKEVPNAWARLADRVRWRLAAVNVYVAGFLFGSAGLLVWLVALFFSSHPWLSALACLTLLVTLFLIWVRYSRRWVVVCSVLSAGVVLFFWVTQWISPRAVGAVALALLVLWYP